jgi:hypothetical protein
LPGKKRTGRKEFKMDENKRIVEIEGIKVEVDMRTAKVIDHYKIGDPVRVLHPGEGYGCGIKAGVIVGFCEFEKNPAIEILELDCDYSGTNFRMVLIVSGQENKVQIAPYEKYAGLISQTDVITRFDREIQKKELELADLKLKKKYFIDDFSKAFERIVPTTPVD